MLEATEWKEQRAQVERFVGRFVPSYRLLVYHAALPLVLTPELVNYLRTEFLRTEGVPWEAEVDFLLSDLCSPVGHELYAMDSKVRAYVLDEISSDPFWQGRMREVGQVLLSYVGLLSRTYPQQRQQELVAQRLAAMTFMGDESCRAAARELAERLQQVGQLSAEGADEQRGIRAQLAQLSRLTQELAPQLKESEGLVNYARVLGEVLRRPEEIAPSELTRSYREGEIELGFDPRWLPQIVRQKLRDVEYTVEGDVSPGFTPLEVTMGVLVREQEPEAEFQAFPPLQEEEFTVAELVREVEDDPAAWPRESAFEFETATVERAQSQGFLGRVFGTQEQVQWRIQRGRGQANHFLEPLPNGGALDMVAIPGGRFRMGSPRREAERASNEGPQHDVSLKTFYMGRYAVTQAQWRAVAAMDQVERKLDAEPSRFKRDDRPVEQVSWEEAVEFCQRLSKYTGREYRLPSEAEWEYACRAGTTTPFHFGETLTTEVANYDGSYVYGDGPKGQYREETTPVGSFPSNAFGLGDMHGNVREWCADYYHDSYKGAPTDGSAWIEGGDEQLRIRRGGSWGYSPGYCRSACRGTYGPAGRVSPIGFRVVCVAPRT